MSKRAEERAMETYPPKMIPFYGLTCNAYSESDANLDKRCLFIEGYEAAEEDLGWHSVDESLPLMGEEVIVLTNVINGRVVDPARYICFGHIVNKEYAVDYDGWNIPGVKYWMPCPKLPEE